MPFPKFGLILGDSILHGYYEQDGAPIDDMKKAFDLDIIRTGFEKGKTISYLSH